jgi:uncharacterized protein YcfL
MKTISIVIITIFCLVSCKDVVEIKEKQNISLTVEELIQAGIDSFDNDLILDSISKKLNDLIVTDTSYYKFYITDFFDKNLNHVQYSFHRKYYIQEKVLKVHFHGFEICIRDNDSIIISGIQNEFNSIYGIYLNYYDVHNDGTYQTELIEDSIKYFGKVQVPDLYTHIGLNVKSSKAFNEKKWQYLFKSINEIIKCYNEIRARVSKEKFNKPFKDLSQTEKESIIEYSPLKIMISFDMEFCSEMVKPEKMGSLEH